MTIEPENTPIEPDQIHQTSGLPDPDGGHLAEQPEDLLGALLGSDGGLDLQTLMEQAQSFQSQMMAAQAAAAQQVVEGVAGGGAVKVSVTGAMEFKAVTIDPAAVDPGDVDMLQDLVLAALHAAVEQVQELQSPGDLDLPGLGGLVGGGA